MIILPAETGIGTASAARTMTEHLFEEVWETTGITARKFLAVGRIPIRTASVRTKSRTRTSKTGTSKSPEASGLLLCPLLRLKLVGMFPVFTIFIIFLSLFRITQHLIRLVDSLKLILGRSIVRIQVRMVLARQLAERFLDVILRCLFVHSKDLIVINISHSLLVLLSKYHKTNNTPICFTHH